MARGKKTGGRKKGVPNNATQARQAKAAADGILPLDVILKTMRLMWDEGERLSACQLARDAAPYLHPKLAPKTAEGTDPVTRVLVGWLEGDE